MLKEFLYDKMVAILHSGEGTYNTLIIKIEMPLPSGVKVMAKVETTEGRKDISISGVRDFYKFAQKYRKADSEIKWNVLIVKMDKAYDIKVSAIYDEELQREAEDAVK